MRVALLTKEFPPDVYGGAGVHVDFLTRELRTLVELDVHSFGAHPAGTTGHAPDHGLTSANAAVQTLASTSRWRRRSTGADVVHSHTWYANLAGHVGSLLHGAAACGDGALPRTAPALEGRAARRRLRGVRWVERRHLRERRRDHRSLRGHEGGSAGRPTPTSTRRGCT